MKPGESLARWLAMTSFEGPARSLPRAVTRQDAIRSLRALISLHESGQVSPREAVAAADGVFIDMGLGHVSLPYLEAGTLEPIDILCALRAVLADDIDIPEPFHHVGPYWPFAL